MTLMLGGHRGLGCTDSELAAYHRDIENLPTENTLESVQAAFSQSADFVEIDVIQSADGIIFCLHNVVPEDHFFAHKKPATLLNNLKWQDFHKIPCGRNKKGKLATLTELLTFIAQTAPLQADYCVNIELKGVLGSKQKADDPSFIPSVAKIARQSPIPADKILFSSFALQNIIDMAQIMPNAKYGMLFYTGTKPKEIYLNNLAKERRQNLPFQEDYIDRASALFRAETPDGARLDFLHPEISTLKLKPFRVLGKKGFKFNSWEHVGLLNQSRKQHYQQILAAAKTHHIDLGLITGHLSALHKVIHNLEDGFR